MLDKTLAKFFALAAFAALMALPAVVLLEQGRGARDEDRERAESICRKCGHEKPGHYSWCDPVERGEGRGARSEGHSEAPVILDEKEGGR